MPDIFGGRFGGRVNLGTRFARSNGSSFLLLWVERAPAESSYIFTSFSDYTYGHVEATINIWGRRDIWRLLSRPKAV